MPLFTRPFFARRTAFIPASVVLAALLGSLLQATPASAIAAADVPADPAAWAAAPYSPIGWGELAPAAGSLELTFDAEAGGLPDSAGIGTGLTAVQPSSAAASSPYYLPANITVGGGALTINATKGIANGTNNNQDNTLGVGLASAGKALLLTTTVTSPVATGFAQGGLWFGADDKNYIKLVIAANTDTGGRQVQLAKEINDVSLPAPSVDQVAITTTQTALAAGPVTLNLLVDSINRRVSATYRVGTAAPVAVGTLADVPAAFFSGALLAPTTRPADSTVTAFGGVFGTKRNMAETTPLAWAFQNFAYAEVDVTPPAAPSQLAASGTPSTVDLGWTAPADTDVVGYRVYRSATSPVALTGTPLSGATPIAATTFRDVATFGGSNYHYAVVAVDALGNTSPAAAVGPAGSSVPAGDPVARVDFTTAAGTPVAGYTKDDGSAYTAARGSGWTGPDGAPLDLTASTRIRAVSGQAADPRLASIIHLQLAANPTAGSWRLDVPNGVYTVVAGVGDSGDGIVNGYDSTHVINAEGVRVVAPFVGTAARQYDEAATTDITVADGTLTIDAVAGANTKLAYLEVYRTALTLITPAVPTGLAATIDGEDVSLGWQAAESAVSYKVYRGTTSAVDTSAAPLATVTEPAYIDLTTEAGSTYFYVVAATSRDDRDSAPSAPLEVVVPEAEEPTPPQLCAAGTWKAELFGGTALAGTPKSITCVSAIDQSFTGGTYPVGLDGPNQYSMRFSKTVNEGAGSYQLTTRTDDGVRVRVDGALVLNAWTAQSADQTRVVQVPLGDGPHEIVVEYYQGFNDASAKVTFTKTITACPPGQWMSEYFAGTSLAGVVTKRACIDEIDQEFGVGEGPAGVGSSLYSARFTRAINEGKGTFEFTARADDGVRVSVDGERIIDEWSDQSATEQYSAEVALSAGSHLVVVEYYQGYNEAAIEVDIVKTSSDTEAPTAPAEISATADDDEIEIGWSASVSTDAVGYRVFRSESLPVDVTGTPLSGTQDLTARSFVDTTAEPDTQYHYVVVAVDDADNASLPSAPATALISTVPDTEAPLAATGLAATAGGGSVQLVWAAPASTDLAGYRVYRSTEPAVATTGTPVSGSALVASTGYTDGTVTNGTTYFYVVVAVDLAGNASTASNEVVAVPNVPNTTNVKVDFTATNAAPVSGYVADWGQAYGLRTGATQGAGTLSYGWLDTDGHELSLVSNGRDRERAGIPALLDSIMHMQYGDANGGTGTNGIKTEGMWELAVPDGLYSVKIGVGDEKGAETYDSNYVVNVEGSLGVNGFVGSDATQYSTVTTTVGVWDGKLTIDARGGVNTKIGYIEVVGLARAPHVDTVLPENRVTGHDVNAGVSATIKVPYAGIGLKPSSLPGNVHLYAVAGGAEVPTTVGSSGGNDVISLAPTTPLAPNTQYRFEVTSGVTDNFGVPFVPFSSLFTTGSGETGASGEFTPLTGVGFQKVELPTGRGKFWASFAFGPDGKLYGTTIGQGIFRFDVAADGTLGEPQSLGYEGVAHIGLLFDESATADNLKVWVTRTTANFSEQGQWVSSIHQLSGDRLQVDRPVFEGLPRSLSDHLTNSMAYGPDGRIYFQQGSNQASGDLDNAWGQRGEQLLTAATLAFDPANPQVATAANGGAAINVKTADGGTYSPYSAGAPLTIYASGIRNAYDLVWHSNDHLYVATNGTAGGANTPGVTANPNGTFTRTAAPGIPGFSTVNGKDVTAQCVRRGYTGGTVPPQGNIATQRDLLFDVVAGGYYGHPNPERCEFVLNAGNNPATPDAPGTKEVKYPLGTAADPNYRGVAYDFEFNKSPNGALEYTSATFGGQLKGRLLITRFSNNNDLIFLQPDSTSGKILGAQTSVGITGVANTTMSGVDGFNDPLEVVEDKSNGNLYVNQYDRSGGDQRLYLLRVPASQQAAAISSSVDELVFSAVKNGTSAAKSVTVTNNGSKPIALANTLTGGQTGEFIVTGGNTTLAPQGSAVLNVTFKPSATVGQRATTLRLTAGDSTVNVGLFGLTMNGIEGGNEPTFANVMGTLGYAINVGWTNLEGGVQPTAKGDEILEPLFVKSGTAAPTMTPLAQYAPKEDLPFGWYTGDGSTAERVKLGSIDTSGYQSLLPPSSPGTVPSFDPGAAKFGFYYYSNTFQRTGFTEDRLNTGIAHRARIYPAKNRAGTIMTNSYIVAFEDASNGDYQDYVFLVTGVKPATDTGSVDGGVRVDFTTATAAVPTGYLRDYGQAFSLRTGAGQGTSLSYGWKNDVTENDVDLSVGGTAGNGRDRATSQTDQRLDTFMHMQGSDVTGTFNGTPIDALWELAVPNGQYTVTVAVGDPAPQTDVEIHQINVEGTALIERFTPSGAAGAATRHRTVTQVVTVADGFVTVDSRGGQNTKISYIDVIPVTDGGGDDPTDGAQVKVNFRTPDAPATDGWTADVGGAFTDAAGFGWVTATGAPVDRSTFLRYRPAPTAGIAFPADPLLRSGAHLQAPTAAVWEYEVPDGEYEVAVSVGDSAFLDSVHTVTAEGQPVVATFAPTGTTPFQTGKRMVTVTDGKLTIAGTGTNTKINWVSIKGDGLETPPPAGASTKVNFQPSTVTAPTGWVADTGAAFDAARGYGWFTGGVATDRSAATRYRNAPTQGITYPTGDLTRQTFILTQAGPVDGVTDGVWQYSVANGTYTVAVSVGDAGFLDSVHGVTIEGTPVITSFTPTGTTPFTTGTAEVVVSDGLLTLTPTGTNTKVDWITITGAEIAAPSITVTSNGTAVGASSTSGPANVVLAATAAGGATVSSLSYALDGAAATPYTAPLALGVGSHTLVVTAVDSAARTSARTVAFTIEDIGGTLVLRNEQATRVNGAPIPGFSEDWLVMQRINSGVVLHQTVDTATVTLTNSGTKPLRISSITISGPQGAQFEITDAPAGVRTVAPGASTPVTVKFIATTGGKGVRAAQLVITSSDPAQPVTTVQLRGGYMTAPEGGSELTLPQISELFGWTTDIGALENGDEMRTSPLAGEEVRSLLWKRADATLPVNVRQLAAFHGCCDQTEVVSVNGATARHAAPYGQSILPPTATATPTQLSTSPTGNFGIIVAGQSTNNIAYMASKTWPVRDRNGAIVAGAWIVGHDYVSSPNQCGIAPTNCDFQDNAYLITNVLPVASSDTVAPTAPGTPTATVGTSDVTLAWPAAVAVAPDLAGYHVERATSATGTYTRLTSTPIRATGFVDSALPAFANTLYYRVIAVDASGNVSTPAASGAVDISGVTGRAILIKSGGAAVTTGGRTFIADTFFTGGAAYRNPAVTQIAGTTDDALYTSERSEAPAFAYDIPVPSGLYEVKLHFAEIYHGATGGGTGGAGKRIFDVNFEGGATEIPALDLNARVAPMTAYVTTNSVGVTDGTLDIDFSARVDYPTISAIEVVRVGDAPIPPAAPSGVTATVAGASVAVSWTAVAGAAGYTVERATSATGPWSVIGGSAPITATSLTDAALPFTSTTYYRVTTVSASGSSAASAVASADVSRLYVPTAVTATPNANGVTVAWTAPVGSGVTGYRVERALAAAGPFTTISTFAVTGLSFTDSAVPFGNAAHYRVIALGAGGAVSAPSAVASTDITGVAQSIRVNAGGPALTVGGRTWSADSGFTGGKAYTNPAVTQIGGTTDDALYLTERSATTNLAPFAYDFALPNGSYEVKLHFAEIFHGATGGGAGGNGKRVFSVNLEGGPAEQANIDLNARVGSMTALVTTNLVTLTDGNLDIDFTSTVDQAKISAIEIVRAVVPQAPTGLVATTTSSAVNLAWQGTPGFYVQRSVAASGPWARISGASLLTTGAYTDGALAVGATAYYRVVSVGATGLESPASAVVSATIAPPVQQPVRINTGGGALTLGGVTWLADSYSTGGKVYSNPAVTQIGGTTNDQLYLNERSTTAAPGSFGYNVPVANGVYTVKLHFAEIFHGATGGGAVGTGKRVFNVNFEEGTPEISGLDISTRVAPMNAFITTNRVTVTGGNLDIDFASTVDQPTIAAIEIIPGTIADATAPAAPTGVAIAATGSGNTVTFAASGSADVSGYIVERASAAAGPFTRLTAVPTAGLSFVDTTAPATAGTVYYRVTAVASSGLTATSAVASITRAATGPTVRINAGGPAVTTGGVSWLADSFYSGGGKSYSNPGVTQIAGTANDVLYLNERSTTVDKGSYSYDIPVPNGAYTVRLHFAEIYHGATGGGAGGNGKRVFSVNLEGGATEIAGLDLNARVAPMTAVVIENTVTVVGGNLDIDFSAAVDQPTLAAIEVVPVPVPAVTPPAQEAPTQVPTQTPPGPDVAPAPTPQVSPSVAPSVSPTATLSETPAAGPAVAATPRGFAPLSRLFPLAEGLVEMPASSVVASLDASQDATQEARQGAVAASGGSAEPEAGAGPEVLSASAASSISPLDDPRARALLLVLLLSAIAAVGTTVVRRRWHK
ncbi:malectin domain-containing carbohydrate-binding protein [Conyzicola sp.]|uniref:malectin domain-containing carbohydrate-binding protein n=1 Tax=Conyzicola sp. TaxID=1969404 RepID=UPI003988F273